MFPFLWNFDKTDHYTNAKIVKSSEFWNFKPIDPVSKIKNNEPGLTIFMFPFLNLYL